MTKFNIFAIDVQNAFTREGNPLCVPGAPEDTKRFGEFIMDHVNDIDGIVATVDTHVVDHIGHPGYWKLADGTEPAPFTFVTPAMVLDGEIAPKDETKIKHVQRYIVELGGAMIWPVHCVPGTDSYNMNTNFTGPVQAWENATSRKLVTVQKGYQKNVESFGVFEAEFDDGDFGADFNTHLAATLLRNRLPIVVGGEALSHCVKRSVEQLADYLDNQFGRGSWPVKVVLLRDCTSPVPGFEIQADEFLENIFTRGVLIETTDTVMAAL